MGSTTSRSVRCRCSRTERPAARSGSRSTRPAPGLSIDVSTSSTTSRRVKMRSTANGYRATRSTTWRDSIVTTSSLHSMSCGLTRRLRCPLRSMPIRAIAATDPSDAGRPGSAHTPADSTSIIPHGAALPRNNAPAIGDLQILAVQTTRTRATGVRYRRSQLWWTGASAGVLRSAEGLESATSPTCRGDLN